MKPKSFALLMLFASLTLATASCGKKKASTATSNIVPGSDSVKHDGQDGPVYTVPHPEDCGTCETAPVNTVDGCVAVVGTSVPCEGVCFVDSNVTTTYYDNPPTSGPEYDYYDYNFYDVANLPRGEYVRQMFHGFVVLAYNCTNCDALLNQLKPYGVKPEGANGSPLAGYGVVVTQDTALPVDSNAFYALSWTWKQHFTAFDKASLECFIKQHYGHGPTVADPNTTASPSPSPTP